PDSPTIASVSPRFTLKLTPSTTVSVRFAAWNSTVRFSTSSTGRAALTLGRACGLEPALHVLSSAVIEERIPAPSSAGGGRWYQFPHARVGVEPAGEVAPS